MPQSARYFFSASADAHRQVTELFDFIHPTTIAMWNLRWQVRGFVESHPTSGQREIDDRFARGIPVNSGAIKKVCVDMPWDDQLENFSAIILVNCIAAFEDFCAQIAHIVEADEGKADILAKKFQFPPSNCIAPKKPALESLGARTSLLNNCVTWDASVARRHSSASIEGLLLCYRYFKEIRNSFAHNGRRASVKAVSAYHDFASCVARGDLASITVPEHDAILAQGDPLKLRYRGVIGLTDVVLRIVSFYDVELCNYGLAKDEISRRISPDLKLTWPTERSRIVRRIASMFREAGFPRVHANRDLIDFLRVSGKIPNYVNI